MKRFVDECLHPSFDGQEDQVAGGGQAVLGGGVLPELSMLLSLCHWGMPCHCTGLQFVIFYLEKSPYQN